MRKTTYVLACCLTLSPLIGTIGCVGASATTLDGREISATGRPFRSVSCSNSDAEAVFTLAPGTVRITRTQLTYGPHQSLPLPANWQRIHLQDSAKQITVTVDGAEFATITPTT